MFAGFCRGSVVVVVSKSNKGGLVMTRYNTKDQQKLIDDTRREIRLRINKRVNKELIDDWVAGKIEFLDCLAMIQREV